MEWEQQLARQADDLRQAIENRDAIAVMRWLELNFGTNPPADWWRTPLGRKVAEIIAPVDTTRITHAEAALILKVARGTVGTLARRKTLPSVKGQLLRGPVLQRMLRLSSEKDHTKS